MASRGIIMDLEPKLPACLYKALPDEHVAAAPGDFVENGILHCGICKAPKEYRRRNPIIGRDFLQPSMCLCEQHERDAREARMRDREAAGECRALKQFWLTESDTADASFENAVVDNANRAAFDEAWQYIQNIDTMVRENCGLLFYGQPGTGKTFLTACIAHALFDHHIPVLFTNVSKLAETRDLSETLSFTRRAKVLILDDFGIERDTPFMAERVYRIINERYSQKKPLILTSNLGLFSDPQNIARERVFDRVRALCKPVRMTGESRRKALGTEKRALMDRLRGIS